MTKNQLLDKLSFINKTKDSLGIEIYFNVSKDQKFILKKGDIADDAKEKILGLIKDYINTSMIDNDQLMCKNLTDIDDRKNTVYAYDYEEIPLELDILNAKVDLQKLPKFDFSLDALEHLRGFLIVVGNAEKEEIRIFKTFSQLSLIKREAKYLGLKEDNQRLVLMDRDVLRISGSFEFMKVDKDIIIVNDKALGVLQRDFGFDKIIREKANTYIERIEKIGLLQDINDIKGVADDLRFAKKIMNIKSTSKVLELKPKIVVEFVLKHTILSKKFKFNKGNTKLVLKTKVSQRLFLQLLNDDFLKSELTNLYYFTENKDTMHEESIPEN